MKKEKKLVITLTEKSKGMTSIEYEGNKELEKVLYTGFLRDLSFKLEIGEIKL